MARCPRCQGLMVLIEDHVQTVVLIQRSCVNCGHKIEVALIGERVEVGLLPEPKPPARQGRPRGPSHTQEAV